MRMKQIFFSIMAIAFLCGNNRICYGQEYFTKNGRISFFSKATIENISADNNQVISLLNLHTGTIMFSVLVNAFNFPKAMMQEHFNSDYMESDKYPSATFKGTITDIDKIDISKDGTYNVNVTGSLQIHGLTKNIAATAVITLEDGKPAAKSVFKILLKDYRIEIPSVVINNISEQIEITVNCVYEKR